MTTAKTPKAPPGFTLPDPPKSQDEKMTASRHLSLTGGAHFLAQHLGNPDTTIVGSDLYLIPVPTTELTSMAGAVYPDLLVAFNADPALYSAQNGYVISEHGKPPDFVLEVASRSTGRRDTVEKRVIYAERGILEYWRFDETGEFHGARLAGDRLVGGGYEPIEIDELPDGSLQGHSAILNVDLRWTNGQLHWYDPATGKHIATFDSEREGRIRAQASAAAEQQAVPRQRPGSGNWKINSANYGANDHPRVNRQIQSPPVFPAKAGTQNGAIHGGLWIPACAGMPIRRRRGCYNS